MMGRGFEIGDEMQVVTFVASAGASGTVSVSMGNLTCSASYRVAYVSLSFFIHSILWVY